MSLRDGLVRFAVLKPVPVNLLMVFLMVGGVFAALSIRREFFPETDAESASVSLIYPGASPEEIETSLATKVEDKVAELKEVKKITTTISEGGGGILVEFRDGVDIVKGVREVERAVDSIGDLPAEAERIQVREIEPNIPAIQLSVHGPVSEEALKRTILGIRDELKTLPGMGQLFLSGVRDYEISVEVSRAKVLEHGLALGEIADAIGAWSAEVPGGTVRGRGENVKVRTLGVEEQPLAIRQIVLRSGPEGPTLRVGDVAQVRQAFADVDVTEHFNGQRSASLNVFRSGKQDIIDMAQAVRAYADGHAGRAFVPTWRERFHEALPGLFGEPLRKRAWRLGAASRVPLPPGARLSLSSDFSRYVQGRLDLLSSNALQSGVLVFVCLMLFISWRSAWWVTMGMITALLGTLLVMWWLDMSLNFLTMFGLIIVVGILVDDGIVVSDNIQALHARGVKSFAAALQGTGEVFWPVVATVTTNIVAFLPLTFVKGQFGDLLGALPWVVAVAMLMSLVEALLILPSHLGHSLVHEDRARTTRHGRWIARVEARRDGLITQIIGVYGWFLRRAVSFRYISCAAALALLILALGLLAGGRVGFTFFPKTDAETVLVDIRMPIGTPLERTAALVADIESAARGLPETQSVSASVGQLANIDLGTVESFPSHVAQLFIELVEVEDRQRTSAQVIEAIRQALGQRLAQAERVRFTEISGGPGDADISLQIRGQDPARMAAAALAARRMLSRFPAVRDISDNSDAGQREVQVRLLPQAPPGFTTAAVAREVRGALYGLEAHVFSDRREDIEVRVRLDHATRNDLAAVEDLWIVGPDRRPVPLRQIARIDQGQTYSTIRRVDRQRALTVVADVSPGVSPEFITQKLPLEELRAQFPELEIEFAGRQEQMRDAFASLPLGLLAAVATIYVLLAWLFNSLTQPLVVMITVPFSLVGAITGHWLMGLDFMFLSMLGYIALTGIVVNDSLVFLEFYNIKRREGLPVDECLVQAGKQRLRPIFLTTLTTVAGLMPIVLEKSFQARFLIPMAVTICFGLISSTVLVLVVMPAVLKVREDLLDAGYYLWNGRSRPHGLPREIELENEMKAQTAAMDLPAR